MMEFRKDRPVWRQVADEMRRRIAAMSPGDLVDSEQSMVQEFGIARGTARKVIAHLREEGVIYTVPGLGSFAGPKPPEDDAEPADRNTS
ncbi:GntR family transcriptional regulator [Nonomuraea deserti]|uniref:GntR family transcriptional regulator n=2 Tax=Nonomuraea deserti TaxID=1848322 RepID=A0A4R4VT65_9ACTN|nr:GntR family transcriptional regulator [Nonomuraea deserti]